MSSDFVRKSLVVVIYTLCVTRGLVQMPNPYGSPISLEEAKKVAAPALAEALKNNWTVAVAVVDTGGILVHFEKMDNTQIGSSDVAIGKARSAVLFKRPTKAFQDTLAAGGDGFRVLGLQGAVPVEGGIPPGFLQGGPHLVSLRWDAVLTPERPGRAPPYRVTQRVSLHSTLPTTT